jgi:hypothetical protein
MTPRKFTPTASPTQSRVAKHREKLKDLGVKRLDLSVTPDAFQALQGWASARNLSYSEAAEHLFLAASAPVNSYLTDTPSLITDNTASASGATNHQNTPLTTAAVRSAPRVDNTSVVAAFFQSRQNKSRAILNPNNTPFSHF